MGRTCITGAHSQGLSWEERALRPGEMHAIGKGVRGKCSFVAIGCEGRGAQERGRNEQPRGEQVAAPGDHRTEQEDGGKVSHDASENCERYERHLRKQHVSST